MGSVEKGLILLRSLWQTDPIGFGWGMFFRRLISELALKTIFPIRRCPSLYGRISPNHTSDIVFRMGVSPWTIGDIWRAWFIRKNTRILSGQTALGDLWRSFIRNTTLQKGRKTYRLWKAGCWYWSCRVVLRWLWIFPITSLSGKPLANPVTFGFFCGRNS